jgi:hypothetical protein
MVKALTRTHDTPPMFVRAARPALYVVYIDVTYGLPLPKWMQNSPAKPLADALAEADALRRDRWICKVEPEA